MMLSPSLWTDCKRKLPHDLQPLVETEKLKVEICRLCSKKFRWNKRAKGRIHNIRWLEAHVRNTAQKWGRTKRIYYKLYQPEKLVIEIP
jgi:hypothetical protein